MTREGWPVLLLIVSWLAGIAVLVLVVLGLLRLVAVHQARLRNAVGEAAPYAVAPAAAALHERLFIADLHADSLLWARNLARRSRDGHLDLPRLREANVALQVFAAVTQVPAGLNFDRNSSRRDLITLLAVAQGWPPRTWGSRLERALYAAARLRRLAARDGRILVVEKASDLEDLATRRRSDPEVIGALLAIEGCQALDGRLENLDRLYDAGFRMIGLQHFFDNEAGGSAHGLSHGGLTDFGRELVRRIQSRRMVLDLAHSSPAVVDDALALATAAVFVSHTGLRGTSEGPRNLSDVHARGVAATGGLLGIAMFEPAVGGPAVDDTALAMRYAADLVGVEHVALGTDFDGAVRTPVDVTGLPVLTHALMRHGFGEPEIALIMGGNVQRVLRQILP
jgi:microsomal dipeptidase-like Zn-dependent dipeptidase